MNITESQVDDFFDSLKDINSMTEEEYIEFIKRRAKRGHAESQYRLGWIWGEKFNRMDKVEKWWLKAAKNGYPQAQYHVGKFYGLKKDVITAFYWYCKAAKNGHPQAQKCLEKIYESGNPVKKDKICESHIIFS